MTIPISERVKAALEFDETKLPPPYDMGPDPTDEKAVFCIGARVEHERLAALHSALVEVLGATEKTLQVSQRGYPTWQEWDALVDIHRKCICAIEKVLGESHGS